MPADDLAPDEEAEDERPPKASDHPSYGTYTLACILLPVIGVLLGVVQMTKPDPIDRKLGEHALAFSILMMIVWGVVVAAV